jgi:cell division septal protein FtsQ
VRLRWKLLAGLVAGIALWFAGPPVLRKVEFFRVRRIELAGLRYGDPHAVTRALRLRPGASVFDDLGAMAQRVRAIPGVREAEVGRRLPGTLTVRIEETEPVALAPRGSGGALALVDLRGRVLPFDPSRAAPDLPIAASADSVLARVLGTVRDSDPALFARLSTAWRVRDDVVLEVEGRRLWLTGNATPEDIRAVTAVAQDLNRRNRGYQELDGRFAGQVIVRGLGA